MASTIATHSRRRPHCRPTSSLQCRGITALEAQHFLGRKPEVILPNGLNIERFAAPHEFQLLHRTNKRLIHEFVMGHFFPSYTFDLDRTLYVFHGGPL